MSGGGQMTGRTLQTHNFPFVKSVLSKQLFPKDAFGGPSTVCPPNTDITPGNVLLKLSTQTETKL